MNSGLIQLWANECIKTLLIIDIVKQPPIQMLIRQNVAHLCTARLAASRVRGEQCELTVGFHKDGKEE
jgi:hypothetical protein